MDSVIFKIAIAFRKPHSVLLGFSWSTNSIFQPSYPSNRTKSPILEP